MQAWYGFDLDGTLIMQDELGDREWDPTVISDELIEPVARIVRKYLRAGKKVKIMTARVSGYKRNPLHVEIVRRAIAAWSLKHFGVELEATNEKDYGMMELWDDRVVQVIRNSGLRADERFQKLREKYLYMIQSYRNYIRGFVTADRASNFLDKEEREV